MTLFLLTLLSGQAQAATFDVPSTSYPNLGDAITAANGSAGPDIIRVAPGRYALSAAQEITDTLTITGATPPREIGDPDVVEDTVVYFDMLGVAVNDPNAATTLSASAMFRVAFGQYLRLENLVLKQAEVLCDNGRDDDGDGSTDNADVHCEALADLDGEDLVDLLSGVSMRAVLARPTSTVELSKVQVQGWSFGVEGAAIYADTNATLTIEDSYFVNNLGRYAVDFSPPLAPPTGSGVFFAGRGIIHLHGVADATITGTRFKENEISYGGAIFAIGAESGPSVVPSVVNILDSVFFSNSAEDGGAIYVESSELIARRNLFIGNSASLEREDGAPLPPRWEGGDIYAEDSEVVLTNNLFSYGETLDYGASLALKVSEGATAPPDSVVMNNVFLGSDTAGVGGLIYLDGQPIDFRNNISVTTGAPVIFGQNLPTSFDPAAGIAFNNFFGNAPGGVFSGTLSRTVVNQTTNLFEDPLFVYYNDNLDFYETWQVRLQIGSPSIDAGDPSMFDVGGSIIDHGIYGGSFAGVVDNDNDGWEDVYDCNDDNAAIYPDAPEDCDDVDNDCDGLVDEGVEAVFYLDADADGYGDRNAAFEYCFGEPQPWGSQTVSELGGDCDDNDPERSPGLSEFCDIKDNDCNGIVNDGIVARVFYTDADGDGFGDPSIPIPGRQTCPPDVSNLSPYPLDCNDADPTVHPLITDEYRDHAPLALAPTEEWETDRDPSYIADFIDQDCDGGDQCYADRDGDGIGEAPTGNFESYVNDDDRNCNNASSFTSSTNTDCDDNDQTIFPSATERPADGVDSNCDGFEICYLDADGDGFGSTQTTTVAEVSCGGLGIAANDEDCDDANPDANPNEAEICDGFDNDCNGEIDEVISSEAEVYYLDEDADGFGRVNFSVKACGQPAGYVPARDEGFDCDDDQPFTYPGNEEVCDDIDNDCNGQVDGDDAVDRITWRADLDDDGFGDCDITVQACSQPAGFVDTRRDCDANDADASVTKGITCSTSGSGTPGQLAWLLAGAGLLTLRRRRR